VLNILIICIITTTEKYFQRKANIIYIVSNQHIIVVFSSAKTLQISYIGMQTQEVAIKPNLRVVLKSDAQLIDEVVVTGYGVTKKAAFTGSAQTVDNKDLMKKTDANFMKSLEGSVAGLQVNSLTGQPGAYASTTIRGVGSMNSGTEPLYVIDGIAIYTDKMGAYNKAGTGDMAASPMANINPNDIESITVLKDATATAIYGARAANGVIVVTTKKGSLGKARFNVNAKVGTSFVGKIDHNYRTTNLDKYKEIWTEGLTNAGYDGEDGMTSAEWLNAYVMDWYNVDLTQNIKSVDWLKEILQNGFSQEYDISAQGGNENLRYYISGGYFQNTGIVIGTGMKRYSGRISLDGKSGRIGYGLSVNGALSDINNTMTESQYTNPIVAVYDIRPFEQVRNEDGTYNYTVNSIGDATNHTLDSFFGTDGDRRFYIQGYFNYDRAFGDHHVGGMLLYNQDEYNSNVNSSLLNSLPKRRMGIAVRAAYDYANRYLFEFNAGYNGSENFAKGHRFGFFPSVSVGWNISQEKFWEPIRNIVSNFKIRGSYGLVGNDQVPYTRFLYMGITTLNDSPSYQTGYGSHKESHNGPTFSRFENEDMTWEVGHKLNVGADIQLFNSLNLTVDAFREIRSNILTTKGSIPNYLGAAKTVIYGNFAKVKNWGVDLAVDYGKQINRDLSIQFKGTFTFARNRVMETDEAADIRPALSAVGKPLNTLWGYVADGLYIDEAGIANNPTSTLGNITIAAGDVKYVDQPDVNGNYDGQIDSDDRVAIGHPTIPEIIYGFGPSITWKKWDFSVFFQGQANVSLMMSGFEPFGTQSKNNVLEWIAEDYWSKENQNPNAKYPRLTKYNNNNNMQSSTYWLRNAAFLKLKNAEVGYNFKWGRVYMSGTNLLTFSPFKLWDPEMGGGKGMAYPTQRTFNLGVQITFK